MWTCGIFETIANYCHLFPSIPIYSAKSDFPSPTAHPPSSISHPSDILQVSRAPQRIDLRSIRASAWTSWAWKAWATSKCSRSMSSPRALKRRKPSRCNLPQGWKVESGWKPGSTTIATPGYCLEDVLGPSLQSSFLVFGKFVQPINALTYFPFPYAVSITPLPQQLWGNRGALVILATCPGSNHSRHSHSKASHSKAALIGAACNAVGRGRFRYSESAMTKGSAPALLG